MGAALGMEISAATRSGKKTDIGGFLLAGTGDHDGGASLHPPPSLLPPLLPLPFLTTRRSLIDLPATWYSTETVSSIHAFYSSADVVVNTLPSTAATELYVGAQAFKSMKNDAIYVNIGRGSTTDQPALIEALQAGLSEEEGKEGDLRITAASLDVTTPEPLEKESPLYTLPNVVLTPHMSVSGLNGRGWCGRDEQRLTCILFSLWVFRFAGRERPIFRPSPRAVRTEPDEGGC